MRVDLCCLEPGTQGMLLDYTKPGIEKHNYPFQIVFCVFVIFRGKTESRR